ncbi:Xaa-Pro peptidase family protein [Petroclostridium sp. X23]|uniref:M24 family metallopeptidase n=1 Tax=Petroclostridium sp. X23 TaxID=3045146 RepID=UPI0024AD78DC|nr:Xaa-Pro peptidase family protein [Petroclostridium sp. X23]WHH59649.1 Xaa-Pro peptidase family protein [Petroclostridium sp. X23]
MFLQKRLTSLQNKLKENNMDAILITSPVSRVYITGFTGTAGYGIVMQSGAFLFTDFRYTQQAREQAKHFNVIEFQGNPLDSINSLLKDHTIRKLGFEDKDVTYAQFEQFKDKMNAVRLEHVGSIIEDLRVIKDEQEIQKMREAARIADLGFKHILGYVKPGMTENDVALELEYFMKRNGAKGLSFETIAASGVRSSLPHGVASMKKIEKGDLLTLDFGCIFEGYCSDMTRTIGIGALDDKQKQIYKIVLEAQMKALDAITAGKTGTEIDKIARDIITDYGYGSQFGHGLGHGVGLEIHEAPRLSVAGENKLKKGMVVTVEPGIYIEGFGGVRIEDMVVVTDSGIDNLTSSTKELLII